MDELDGGRIPEEAIPELLGEDWPLVDVLTVWVILEVKKIVLTPSVLLIGELGVLLLVLCDSDVVKPMPDEMF